MRLKWDKTHTKICEICGFIVINDLQVEIESDKTTSIYNVSTRVLSKK